MRTREICYNGEAQKMWTPRGPRKDDTEDILAIKVLGPAGGREAFDAAIAAGADEIYMGLSGYGARRYAENFTVDQFVTALSDAHRLGVKLSLTLNTLMSESEIETVLPNLDRLVSAGLDNIIVQDWGVVRFLRRRYPRLAIHGSTQMGLASAHEIQFAADCGLTRVILPRELSLDEIASIRAANKEIELEVFCSGALCLGCSGKCYLSSYVGGRSGNRGCCAQPCRQSYKLESEDDLLDSSEGYFLSLRDQLFTQNDIAELSALGIDVIKIEGRMKSPAYVFEAVRRYRTIVDRLPSDGNAPVNESLQPIERIFNRGYGPGFLHEHDPDILNLHYGSHHGFLAGEVRGGKICLSTPLVNGDGIVYLDENFKKLDGANVSLIRLQPKLYGDRVEKVPRAEAGSLVTLDIPVPPAAKYLYKTFDFSQLKETAHLRKTTRRRRPITVSLTARVGVPLRLTLALADPASPGRSVTVESDQLLEKSHKQRLDRRMLTDAVDRFGNSPFSLRNARYVFDPDVFLPKSLLNGLRQMATAQLEALCAASRDADPLREMGACILSSESVEYGNSDSDADPPPLRYAAAVRTLVQGAAALSEDITQIYRIPAPIRFEDESLLDQMEKELLGDGTELNGVFRFQPLAGNISEALFFEERRIPFATDTSFNVVNYESGLFLLEKFPHLVTIYLSNELSQVSLLRLGDRLIPHLASRGGRVGHSVYGHPIAMYTRKTLFNRRKTILDCQGRKFVVLRNREFFGEKELTTPVSGSSVIYTPPLNILRETNGFPAGWELRFDFTIESPTEIRDATNRWKSKNNGQGVGYGFEHPIF